MSSILYPDLKQAILDQNNDPGAIIGMKMGLIEEALFTDNVLVADPGNPLVFLCESDTVGTVAAIESYEILSQRHYPLMANNEAQLFSHLTDKDYLDMFSRPGVMPIELWVSEEEILEKAVPVPGTSTRKLTLGKHSTIRVNAIDFTLQYPVDFLVKSHNAIEVVYNGNNPSPLQNLTGNKIVARMMRVRNQGGGGDVTRMLAVPITFLQMSLITAQFEPEISTISKEVYGFSDKFFALRAFTQNQANQWVELHTTHSEQTFNITKPTIIVTVIGQSVQVELPHIYVQSGQITRTIRIDIYTTKGDLYESFSQVSSNGFRLTQQDYDNEDGGVYTSAMMSLNTVSMIGTQTPLNGGKDAPTFEERRERVLRNTVYDSKMPISNAQVETTLQDLGFDATMNIDTLTERTYLATRTMPLNTAGFSSTGVDTAMMTMRATFEDLLKFETMRENESQLTVLPTTLYKDQLGELVIVSDQERIALDGLVGEALVNALSDNTYLTSPLHYVLDPSDNTFEARPYFLTQPSIQITSWVASNDSIDLMVSASRNLTISYTDSGYVIQVVTDSNTAYKALPAESLFAQLSFIPDGENSQTFMNGELIATTANGERVFEFKIGSNWEISKKHMLTTTNFTRPGSAPPSYPCPLEGKFSLVWGVTGYPGPESDVDDALGYHLLNSDALGVYHEELFIKLGDELTGLWARSRAFMSTRQYKTYDEDIPAVWDVTQFEYDTTGNVIVEEVDGVKRLKVLHAKGSPRLGDDGEVMIKHRKGAVMIVNGEKILENDRKTERWWEVTLFDGAYRYATRDGDVTYYENIPKILATWINTTLGGLRDLLERTDLFFHPKNTLRYFEVLLDDTELSTIYGSQQFVVTLFVTNEVERNASLRTSLETSAIQALMRALDTSRVTKLDLEDAIKVALSGDAITVVVEGLGSAQRPASVVSIIEDTNRLTIRKRPSLEPDGSIAIRDSVEVIFKRHAINN